MTDQPSTPELTPEQRIERLERQVATLAELVGIRFYSPEEEAALTVHTIYGDKTRAVIEAEMAELGIDIEEYAIRFCGCDEHVIARAQRDLGLPADGA